MVICLYPFLTSRVLESNMHHFLEPCPSPKIWKDYGVEWLHVITDSEERTFSFKGREMAVRQTLVKIKTMAREGWRMAKV